MSAFSKTRRMMPMFASAAMLLAACASGPSAKWSLDPARDVRAADQTKDIDEMTGRNIRYVTQDAMYLANEQWLLYACELPGGQTDLGSDFNKDSYWYSRYNLGNLLFRSGMGVHMVMNPLFKDHSDNDRTPDGKKMFPTPKDFMHFKIRQFCARTGVPCRLDPENMNNPKAFPPKGVFPIFLEFASGVPRFQQAPVIDDLSTLRWDPASMDQTIYLGSLGQTLVKQVLWCEDFFAYHKEGPDGTTLFGNDKEWGNGFRGAALTAEAITKMFTLKSTLVYDPKTGRLGGINPKEYNPKDGLLYHPHGIKVHLVKKPGMPPMPVAYEVVDDSSHLFDQASLLWGASEFYYYSDPKVKDSFDGLFGDQKDHKTDGAMFPLKPHMLSMGLSAVAFKNLMAMHFDKENGTFHSVAKPGKKSGDITTSDAGIALVALANAHSRLHDAPEMLRGGIKMAIGAQAGFLKEKLTSPDGGFYNAYTIGEGPDRSTPSLESQGLGIRGLLAAYSVTGDKSLKDAALAAYANLNEKFWSDAGGAYRSQEGALSSIYSPKNVGAAIGALRELALATSGARRREIVEKLDRFFATTQTGHGQQLAEIDPTGEPIPPMAKIKAMKAKLMKLKKENPEKAKKMMMQMADVDGDGIPKPGMAGGEFGFAPVPALAVTRETR